ncbi:MAG: hypothetical protein QW542_01345 [Thermoproteota archaeon]
MVDLTNIEDIKALIKNIISILEGVPEPYRQKSFEILLTIFLQRELALVTSKPPEEKMGEIAVPTGKFVIPIDVKAFLQQQNVPEECLAKLFYMTGTEIRPIYNITTTKKTTAQIQLALLSALENALKGGKFEFSIEEVRQKCTEHKCYDASQFKGYFKKRSKLFKDLSDEEHVELSPDGKVELAETILEIAK